MKIVLKTVAGQATTYEVADSDTVGQLKARLAEEGYDLPSLKLCSKGQVLQDAKTFQELGFGESETLIVAGKKKTIPPPAPAPTQTAPPSATPSATPVNTVSSTATTTNSSPAPASNAATTTTPQSQTSTTSAPPPAPTRSAPVPTPTGAGAGGPPVDPEVVEQIMAMGFDDRNQVIKALRCAYMNPDRAVEYLFSGIPASVLAQFEAQQAAPPQSHAPSHPHTSHPPSTTSGSQPQTTTTGGTAQGSGQGGITPEQLAAMMQQMQQQQSGRTPLEQALLSIPHFDQIRALVRQNPAALPAVMQQLQQHSPELFAMVQQNPQEFLRIMNEGGSASSGSGSPTGTGDEEPGEGGVTTMQITPADREAIQRLVALGGGMWDARAAAIVYLACRKNEELAANVLFDNGGLPAELADAEIQGDPESPE